MSDAQDLTEWIVDALKPIIDELLDRIETPLPEPDLTAVLTALQKAAIAGALNGAAAVQADARDKGLPLDLSIAGNNYDDWAERFGRWGTSD